MMMINVMIMIMMVVVKTYHSLPWGSWEALTPPGWNTPSLGSRIGRLQHVIIIVIIVITAMLRMMMNIKQWLSLSLILVVGRLALFFFPNASFLPQIGSSMIATLLALTEKPNLTIWQIAKTSTDLCTFCLFGPYPLNFLSHSHTKPIDQTDVLYTYQTTLDFLQNLSCSMENQSHC